MAKRLAKLVAKPLTKRFSIGLFCISAALTSISTNVSTGRADTSRGFVGSKTVCFFDMINSSVLCVLGDGCVFLDWRGSVCEASGVSKGFSGRIVPQLMDPSKSSKLRQTNPQGVPDLF